MIFDPHNIGRPRAKATVAAVKFLISSAVRYHVTAAVFNNELQQLGLPKEHSNVICSKFEEYFDALREHHFNVTFRQTQLADIHLEEEEEAAAAEGYTNIQLTTNYEIYKGIVQDKRQHKLTIRNEDLESLVSELEIARKLMKEYS